MIDRFVDEEVLFREGLALGLDRGDQIVRRRIVQKMQFLQQDTQPPREPTETDLRSWYDAHRLQYATPPRVSFTHIFFSAGRGGDEVARAHAVAVLGSLKGGVTRAPDRGDSFPDLYDYTAFGPGEAVRLFGGSPIAQALFSVPTGRWVGPIQSSYGWHLIYISARTPAGTQGFEAVRDQVRADWLVAAQANSNRASFEALKRRFKVVRSYHRRAS